MDENNDADGIWFDEDFIDSNPSRDNGKMYTDLQEWAGKNSITTKELLEPIENKIDTLWISIILDGETQKVNGKKNKLIKINENHAESLDLITRNFDEAVKKVLDRLALTHEENLILNASKARKNLEKGLKTDSVFRTPISTKLKYNKERLIWNNKQIRRVIRHLKMLQISRISNVEEGVLPLLNKEEFDKKMTKTICGYYYDNLVDGAHEILKALLDKEEVWLQNIKSVDSRKKKSRSRRCRKNPYWRKS